MAERELDLLIQVVAEAIDDQVGRPECRPGKYDLWLTYIKRVGSGESAVLPGRRSVIDASGPTDLLYEVSAAVVLSVFGDEVQVVDELPNLQVRLLDRKGTVRLPGAPDPQQDGQIWLKVAVNRHEPGLWKRLFGKESAPRTP